MENETNLRDIKDCQQIWNVISYKDTDYQIDSGEWN